VNGEWKFFVICGEFLAGDWRTGGRSNYLSNTLTLRIPFFSTVNYLKIIPPYDTYLKGFNKGIYILRGLSSS
jgi:hypothetical protein